MSACAAAWIAKMRLKLVLGVVIIMAGLALIWVLLGWSGISCSKHLGSAAKEDRRGVGGDHELLRGAEGPSFVEAVQPLKVDLQLVASENWHRLADDIISQLVDIRLLEGTGAALGRRSIPSGLRAGVETDRSAIQCQVFFGPFLGKHTYVEVEFSKSEEWIEQRLNAMLVAYEVYEVFAASCSESRGKRAVVYVCSAGDVSEGFFRFRGALMNIRTTGINADFGLGQIEALCRRVRASVCAYYETEIGPLLQLLE